MKFTEYLILQESLLNERDDVDHREAEAFANMVMNIFKAGNRKYFEVIPSKYIKITIPTPFAFDHYPYVYILPKDENRPNVRGGYDSVNRSINLYFSKLAELLNMDVDSAITTLNKWVSGSAYGKLYNQIKATLVHEYIHYLDDKKSLGKYNKNYIKIVDIDKDAPESETKLTNDEKNKIKQDARNRRYYRSSHEQNAFFTTFFRTLPDIDKSDYKKAEEVMGTEHWYTQLTTIDKKKMKIRLYNTVENYKDYPNLYTTKDLNAAIKENDIDLFATIVSRGVLPDIHSLLIAIDTPEIDFDIVETLLMVGKVPAHAATLEHLVKSDNINIADLIIDNYGEGLYPTREELLDLKRIASKKMKAYLDNKFKDII